MAMMKTERAWRGWCVVLLYTGLLVPACAADATKVAPERAAGPKADGNADAALPDIHDAAHPQDALAAVPDASLERDATNPPGMSSGSGGCPVHVSVTTYSYGTGNHDDDDYAPNNVGAVWVTTAAGAFVRTLAAWGPNYWEFAVTWVQQSNGSRVDIVAGATRKNHNQPIEADWDCRDKNLQTVPAGQYLLNVEFAETEHVARSLIGGRALSFEIGPSAKSLSVAPGEAFGSIAVRIAP
jgi:hypothetical protein